MITRRRMLTHLSVAPIVLSACGSTRPRRQAKPKNQFSSLTGFCRDATPIAASEYIRRRNKVRTLLERENASALLCEAGATQTYFSGGAWYRSERPLLLCIPRDDDAFWVGPAFEEQTLREKTVHKEKFLPWQEDQDPYALVVKAVRPGSRPIALAPTARSFIHHGLKNARAATTNGRDIVDECRMVKSPAEVSLLEQANLATKAAIEEAKRQTRVGMTESDVKELITQAQREAGLSNVWVLVGFGENAAFPHGTKKQRALREEDYILVDTGGELHGYQSDVSRTWSLGEPSKEAQRAWKTVLEAQLAAADALKPGATCGSIDKVARDVIAKSGFGKGYKVFTHRLGHGIGLEGHEAPYLVRGSDLVLRPGMTMSNEPGIYIPGKFGIRIEDIFAITENGSRAFGPLVER